jgi:hypothetical protein
MISSTIVVYNNDMESSGKQLSRNYALPIRDYPETSGEAFNAYLKPSDISPEEEEKILNKLNSFDSVKQLKNNIHIRQRALGTSDAQRILNSKAHFGEFQDLQQIATVTGIGPQKFDFIVRSLSN